MKRKTQQKNKKVTSIPPQHNQKVSIIMPVYNERKNFETTLSRVRNVNLPGLQKEIIIVEGASTDGSNKIVDKYRNEPEISVYHVRRYCGKGFKVRIGLKKATGDIIIIQDADDEYYPEDYPIVLKPILEERTKFVLGSRVLGRKSWQIRRFTRHNKTSANILNLGSEIFNWIFLILYGVRTTDAVTMFKVFRRECIQNIRWRSEGFHFDWELLIKLVKKGYKPIEVPIRYKSRSMKEGKKVRIIRDGFGALWAVIYFRFFN